MKKFVTLLILCLGLVVSCYDDTALIERIDALEQTTIAALQTSITALEAKYTELKDSIVPSSEIENKISELKEWMEKLINGYYTKEEIDQQLKLLNTEIKTLETLINSLIGDFAIEFDNSEIGILAGGTTSVGYTITGATEKTTVKALGQNGWSAKVTPEGTDKGKITITAPNPLTEDEIIVLVYDGEYRTIMSSINFVTGVVTPSQTAVELEAGAGTVDISVTSNLNYKVSIPEDAKEWLSIVETKATKTETITFAYTENPSTLRVAIVQFVDDANNVINSSTFIQGGDITEVNVSEGNLSEILKNVTFIKNLYISGTLNNDDFYFIRQLPSLKYLDISNTTNTELPEMVFAGMPLEELLLPQNLTSIPAKLCEKCTNLHSVHFYDKVQTIGESAFIYCNLKGDLVIGDNVISIGAHCFQENQLESVTIGNGVEIIGVMAFAYNRTLKTIKLGKNLKSIYCGFNSCDSLTGIIELPSKLENITSGSFTSYYVLENLKGFRCLGENPPSLDDDAIANYDYLEVPKGAKESYKSAKGWKNFLVIKEI